MTPSQDWKEAAEKHCLQFMRGRAIFSSDQVKCIRESFLAGAEHGYEEGYDDGLLKGSEVGDATAKRAKKERDLDMELLQKERIEFVTERDQLKQQAENREETNRQVSTALVHAYAEIEQLEQRLEDAEHFESLYNSAHSQCAKLLTERVQLEQQLAVAIEALQRIDLQPDEIGLEADNASEEHQQCWHIAHEALYQIAKHAGGKPNVSE